MIRQGAIALFELLGGVVMFGRAAYWTLLTTPPYLGETLKQTYRITMGCMPVVLLVSMFIGANTVVQGHQVLKMLGAESLVGMFASFTLVRELGPVLAGAMVAAKAGSEIASELATMRIRAQIDAIAVMGVDPVRFLVVPRIVASMFAMTALTVFALYAAIAAGYVVGVVQFGINGQSFLEQIAFTTKMHDVYAAIVKAVLFGGVLSVIQAYSGFSAQPGPLGVGLATNRAVVVGTTAIAWVNLMVTGVMY